MNQAKTIAVTNQKGGVGKTTTAVNLASALGILEYRVLLIDIDPQANASSGLGIIPLEQQKSAARLFDPDTNGLHQVTQTHSPNLDIIPGSIQLVHLEINPETSSVHRLDKALKPVKSVYEFIIIDCAPSLGYITLNALVTSDSVLIPVQCEYLATEGMYQLFNTLKFVRQKHNPKLDIEGILITMFDKRLKHSQQIVSMIKTFFEKLVFRTVIKRNVSLGEAPNFGTNIFEYQISSEGSKNYLNLANEIISNQNTMNKTKTVLGTNIQDIIKNNAESLKMLETKRAKHLNHFDNFTKTSKDYVKLKGLSKQEVIDIFGLTYNDIHSNLWMYRISDKTSVFRKNYLYLKFNKGTVRKIELKRFKKG